MSRLSPSYIRNAYVKLYVYMLYVYMLRSGAQGRRDAI